MKMVRVVVVALVAATVAVTGGAGASLTWADVLGVATPAPLHAHTQETTNPEDDMFHQYYDDDSPFFEGDYEYVDTEDPLYTPPPPVQDHDNTQAQERTLDFIYHMLRRGTNTDPHRHNTTPRPSMLEAVFRTIDQHILEDLKDWGVYNGPTDPHELNHVREQLAIKPAPKPTPAAGYSQAQAAEASSDTLVVKDEQGRDHLVTINDIVTSLGHLDEQTLVDLLLSPSPNIERSASDLDALAAILSQPPAPTPLVVPSGTVVLTPESQQRPARHTGPTQPLGLLQPKSVASLGSIANLGTIQSNPSKNPGTKHRDGGVTTLGEGEDEAYVVHDEDGNLQVVTLQDILDSLAVLDSSSVNSLLFNGAQDAPLTLKHSQPKQPITTTTSAPPTKKATTQKPPTNNKNVNGDVAVLANTGSNDGVNNHQLQHPLQTQHNAFPVTSQVIKGAKVEKDISGNLHITPDPARPFTLNVQDILALAQQAEKKEVLPKPVQDTRAVYHAQPDTHRGQQLLSFLAGENILPGPIEPTKREASQDKAPTLAQLLQVLPIHTTTPPPPSPQPQNTSGGLGSTLSNLLGRLVGQSTAPAENTQIAANPNENEFIRLVVRQQDRQQDTVFGDVTIPLPKPIHFRPTPAPATTTSTPKSTGVSPLLGNLPSAVINSLRHQLHNVPKYVPPTLRRSAQDPQPQQNAQARADTPEPSQSPTQTNTNPLPKDIVRRLSPSVLKKIISQVAERRSASATLPRTQAVQSPAKPDHARDRSSYATVPEDSYVGHSHIPELSYTTEGPSNPLFDIYFLADATTLYKQGDVNLSLDQPKIGDPAYFVDTRSHLYPYSAYKGHKAHGSTAYHQPQVHSPHHYYK